MKIIRAQLSHVNSAAKVLIEGYFDSLTDAKNRLRVKIKSKECYVAIEGTEIAGVMMYARDYTHYANYEEDIIISKKHRRKGIASNFLKKFIELSKKETPKKQKYTLSSTDVTNKASIKLHLSVGFKEIGRMKNLHYGKDEIFFGYKLR